jgi:hypothetical protein
MCEDFKHALQLMSGLSETQADVLLVPVDKQNVPLAVNLLKHLLDGSKKTPPPSIKPSFVNCLHVIHFLTTLLSYFLKPFMNIEMSLSQQLQSLATYSHLLTAMHLKHWSGFMNTALFADSQSVVKNIFHTTARLKLLDPDLNYYILFDGSDCLEGIFLNVWTQDHAWNFDVLQLAHKRAKMNAVFEWNPNLYQRQHKKRDVCSSCVGDHLNPKTWKGDVKVQGIDITWSYLARHDAADTLLNEFSIDLEGHSVDWDALFSNANPDHLCPEGNYVGSWAIVTDPEEDDDLQRLHGDLNQATATVLDLDNNTEGLVVDDAAIDLLLDNHDDVEDNLQCSNIDPMLDNDIPLEEILNPSSTPCNRSLYFNVGGPKSQHINAIVAEYLVLDRARKSIQCNLQVCDITINESIQHIHNSNDPNGLPDQTHIVKHGDLGGFLVQLPDKVCFTVSKVISVHRHGTQRDLKSLPVNDLIMSGSKETMVIVQILRLTPANYESLCSKVSSFHRAKKMYALLTPITDAINHAICHVSVLLFLNSVFVPISYVVIPFII